MILPRASCEDCARITCRFETIVQQHQIWPLRRDLGLSSPKRKPKPHIRIPTSIGNEKVEFRDMNPNETTLQASFPIFGMLPGALTGEPKDASPQLGTLDIANLTNPRSFDELTNVIKTNLLSYTRMFAKIAHAYGVAHVGLDAFQPLLSEFILGKNDFWSYYVGAAVDDRLLHTEPYLHWVELFIATTKVEGRMLLARVHLFAPYSLPACDVVIGRLRDSS